MFRRINLSAAVIVLVCFFLPWEQVSCGGSNDTLTGLELARHESTLLWVIPLLMLAVLVFGLVRRRAARAQRLAIVSIVAAGITAYLLNDERARVRDAAGLLSAQLTGWFWLAFIAALTMLATAVVLLVKQPRAPAENI